MRLLERLTETTSWTPPGEPLHFDMTAHLGDGARAEYGIHAVVSDWDGDSKQPVLLFKLDFEG